MMIQIYKLQERLKIAYFCIYYNRGSVDIIDHGVTQALE